MRLPLPRLSSSALVGLALLGLAHLAAPAQSHAQVIIQGEVTVGTDPGYNQQYPQQQYPGNYAQPADPNGYPVYVQQQPVAVSQPQPIRYIHRSATIPGILVPGILLLVGGYLTEAIGAPLLDGSWDNPDQLGFAYIPILGPWLQLGAFDDLDFAFERGIAYFPVIAGIAQTLGLILTVIGLTVREEWDEPVYALTDDPMGPTLAFDGQRATLTF
jgi:hypothetical protein